MAAALLAALGIQAAQGALGYAQQKQQYSANKAFNKRNHKLIDEELGESYADNLLRAMQEMMALKASLADQQREFLQRKGTAITAAGEAGVSGNSVDAMMGDLAGSAARSRDRERQNTEFSLSALQRERRALSNRAKRAKAGYTPPTKPSLLGSIVGTGAQMASTYYRNK